MHKINKILLIFFIIFGFNYGVSYQQFRHFDWTDPRGLSDSASYLEMSKGNYNVSSTHRYRVVIPYLANIVRNTIQSFIPSSQSHAIDALSFYIVNYLITSLTGLFLYLFLRELKFDTKFSLLGVFIFLGSRITILSTGSPLIDSFYYLSIIVILYFCLIQKTLALCLLNPLLILAKETTVPFLFIPLFIKKINRKFILISLVVSFITLWGMRNIVTETLPNTISTNDPILNVVIQHLEGSIQNIMSAFFSLSGWHWLFSTFSIFGIFALIGLWIDVKKILVKHRENGLNIQKDLKEIKVPLFIFWIVPITFGLMALSSNTARMALSMFPLVIPYALIGLEYIFSKIDLNKDDQNNKLA